MTDPFSQPYVFPGADRPEPSRPLFGKIIGWAALVIGLVILLGSLVDFSLAGFVVGVCAAAAGGAYLFGKPSRGRIIWATPALATLPALVAFGIGGATTDREDAPEPAAFAAPAIADVSTTTSRNTTTTPATTTTTIAPTPETVTVYTPPPLTTTQYVPAPAPAPVYIAEPEPVYVPPAPIVAEAPSFVIYANCDAVRAAGAAPIYAGDPGYSIKLDRDQDGVGCEK